MPRSRPVDALIPGYRVTLARLRQSGMKQSAEGELSRAADARPDR